jgi:HEAT repeat protein
MPSFLRFEFQFMSFWAGVLAATLFWWLFFLIRSQAANWRKAIQNQAQTMRESLTASTESRLRNDTFRNIQGMHLAAALFPLDEVLVEPRLLYEPGPASETEEVSTYLQALPHLPEWPELPAAFNAPTLSLIEALQGGANLILIGQPGSGKSVALAYLAGQLARNEASLGKLTNHIPVLIHASSIPASIPEGKTPASILVDALTSRVSTLTLARLPQLIEKSLESGEIVILLDGLDELPPAQGRQVARWVGALQQASPKARWVAAVSPEDFVGLNQLGMIPVSLAAWGQRQRAEFVTKWQQSWLRSMVPANQQETAEPHTLLLNHWLLYAENNLTALEFMLKVWAAYAGDALGPEATRTIETLLRRLTVNIANAQPALETLAQQMLITLNPICSRQEAENWLAAYETVSPAAEKAPAKSDKASTSKAASSASRLVPQLLNNGVLVSHPNGQISFAHPVLMGYLAGRAFAKGGAQNLVNMPDWSGKTLTLAYAAAFGDLSSQVNELLSSKTDPLLRNMLLPLRWLRLAPKNTPWRTVTLRAVVTHLQKEDVSIHFGTRALIALAQSGESGLVSIFRQWLKSDNGMLRYLAILGCGLLNDGKAVNDLVAQTQDDSIPILGQAACLALARIPEKAARDGLLSGLLHGNEIIRNTAAEILAYDPEEGMQILQEASQMEDLMVRRAAVFGLSRVRQPWAVQMLEHIAVEDAQWLVRSAAAQSLEEYKKGSAQGIRPNPPLHEMPWLIDYAAQQGMGVSPGKPAYELLLKALKEGDENQKMQALNYLRLHGNQDAIVLLYNLFYGSEGELHEAVYNTLWHIAASGVTLPPPTQFGLG